jgi:AcrR family transcriptional regulator
MTKDTTAKAAKRTRGALRWVKLPHQARSQEKLDRVIAAAIKLINEKGFQATSVPDIAREAGCSVGLFYTRFKDKAELLRYLVEHHLGEVEATAREVLRPEPWAGVTLAGMVRACVTGMVELHRRRPGLVYAFYENVRTDPMIAKRVLGVHREIERLATALLNERASEMTHPDPDLAVRFGIRLVVGFLQNRTIVGRAMPQAEDVGWDEVTSELTRAVTGYLGVEPPSAAQPARGAGARARRRLRAVPSATRPR